VLDTPHEEEGQCDQSDQDEEPGWEEQNVNSKTKTAHGSGNVAAQTAIFSGSYYFSIIIGA
jgi:hypothetical protein